MATTSLLGEYHSLSRNVSHPVAGKVAVVTGSSRSIGAAAAKSLGAAGAKVVVNYATNASAAEGVVNDIKSVGQGDAIAVKADVFTVEGGKSLVDAAVAKWGRLDILVLTAGIMGSKPMVDVDEEFFDRHMHANVKAPLFTAKYAAQHLGRMYILCLFEMQCHMFVLQREGVSSLSRPA